MSTPATAAAVLALPDEALVPVAWVRPLLQREGSCDSDDGLGLTVAEVANRATRAPSTIRTWCAEGRLPGARRLRGREWRIPAAALRALLETDSPGDERGAGTRQRLQAPKGGLAAWREVQR
ncbi:MAG: helix-turn-helix domain-containing protein [Longimicrobiales bacterium]